MTNFNLANAVNFLRTQMYIPENKLFIESTNPTGTKHYISSANCLASTAIRNYDRAMSDDCIGMIKDLARTLNKTIQTYWYPLFHPIIVEGSESWLTYEELGTTETSWTTMNGHEVVCNNSESGTIDCSTITYANRAMLHSLWLIQENYNNQTEANTAAAQSCFARALTFWDGKGFMDQIQTHYDAYKTGLGLYCLKFSELAEVADGVNFTLRDDLFDAIQNPTNGGVYGRYKHDAGTDELYVEGTFENTEATSLFILAQAEAC